MDSEKMKSNGGIGSPYSSMQNFAELPLGLEKALVGNLSAMQIFAEMPDPERRAFIDGARSIKGRGEMKKYVSALKKDLKL